VCNGFFNGFFEKPPRGQLHNRLILRRRRGAFGAFQKDLFLEKREVDV